MMQTNKTVFESLFHRNYDDPLNIQFLEKITNEHPYFSPAHFFFLQQTSESSGNYASLVNKANIFFNNAYWLNFQLKQYNSSTLVKESSNETDQKISSAQTITNTDTIIKENETDKTEELLPFNIKLTFPEQQQNSGKELLFEPMHVVDYFASQGIKLTEEMQSGDRLGKQLKSFTQWLKTMKKVHEMDNSPSEENDSMVQTLAEKSNTGNEIVTEAMAAVFAQQGKTEKAREILEKLSLLNPAKSTYFAAKIESLK